MFGFKQRAEERARRAAEAAEEGRKLQEAEQMGRDIAGRTTAAVDQFIALRARPTAERLYSVFVGLVSVPETGQNISEIDFIRGHARVFHEELDGFKALMIQECDKNVSEWLEIARKTNTLEDVRAYINHHMTGLYLEMITRAAEFAGGLILALQARGVKAISTAHYDTGEPTLQS